MKITKTLRDIRMRWQRNIRKLILTITYDGFLTRR